MNCLDCVICVPWDLPTCYWVIIITAMMGEVPPMGLVWCSKFLGAELQEGMSQIEIQACDPMEDHDRFC